jgi:succinate dehydrogenase / fumarate reductase, cytochrome b subunit
MRTLQMRPALWAIAGTVSWRYNGVGICWKEHVMAKAEARPSRPLSPHLSIFRPTINMVMSIVHRLTGLVNYGGSLLLALWLALAASGPAGYDTASAIAGSPFGLLMLFGLSWSLIHHACGGIRHFIWDMGAALTKPSFRFLSWMTIVGSLVITALVWLIGLAKWGVL